MWWIEINSRVKFIIPNGKPRLFQPAFLSHSCIFSLNLFPPPYTPCKSQALSLRKQVESIKRERAAMGIELDSPCGPGAPCRARLEAMEVAHQKALQEVQEKHKREIRELEEQRDMLLQDKSQAAAKGMLVTTTESSVEVQSDTNQARLRVCFLLVDAYFSLKNHISELESLMKY